MFLNLLSQSQGQVIDSTFYNWVVYEFEDGEYGEKKCYIVSHPIKSDSSHNSRQNPYIMITRFQKTRTEEVSIYSGFEYKHNSDVFMMIDQRQFKFTAKNDLAWVYTKAQDLAIIDNMLNAFVIKVRSDSAFGTYAVDEYSTKGIARAYQRMHKICS